VPPVYTYRASAREKGVTACILQHQCKVPIPQLNVHQQKLCKLLLSGFASLCKACANSPTGVATYNLHPYSVLVCALLCNMPMYEPMTPNSCHALTLFTAQLQRRLGHAKVGKEGSMYGALDHVRVPTSSSSSLYSISSAIRCRELSGSLKNTGRQMRDRSLPTHSLMIDQRLTLFSRSFGVGSRSRRGGGGSSCFSHSGMSSLPQDSDIPLQHCGVTLKTSFHPTSALIAMQHPTMDGLPSSWHSLMSQPLQGSDQCYSL